MPIKKYGIYLLFPPTIDLRSHGLGRHLAEFMKAAQDRKDVCFVIACPSWMKPSLIELFDDVGIQHDRFEIIAPRNKPLLVVAYERYVKFKGRFEKKPKRNNTFKNYYEYIRKRLSNVKYSIEKVIISARSNVLLGIFFILVIPYLLVLGLINPLFRFFSGVLYALCSSHIKSCKSFVKNILSQIKKILKSSKDNLKVLEYFEIMIKHEAKLINNLINSRSDIVAWYCPTAFWPDFNEIKTSRLMCVPDVVMTNFPIFYALASANRTLDSFRQIEKSIEGGKYFITYTENVKWHTLVQRYQVDSEKIFVVPHGAIFLDNFVKVSRPLYDENKAASILFCRRLLINASYKSAIKLNRTNILINDFKFMFYPSQFRSHKNVIFLLKAYDYLLKRRYITHKLILTGNPNALPEIAQFVSDYHLENDVLFLHKLSTQELAACYKLADLAINPSLSEGGFPFTFTEALSVDTPVVMARIPVTLEVIKDPDLDKDMLFDPYDWRDMADRIEWGLQNKESLLAKQKLFYDVLKQRTWRTVVDEHIAILDRISTADSDQKKLKEAA